MFKLKNSRVFEAAMGDGAGGGASNATNANGQPGAGAANQAWFPDNHKSFVETKGWKSPAEALDSYVNLEKLFGADKAGRTVVLPKDDKDVEGVKAFRAKLGVPESADKYELPLPDGDDGAFAKIASKWMHDAGVPKSAAQTIAKEWNGYFEGMLRQEQEAAAAKSQQELATLKTELGPEYGKKEELAKRAFKAFGGKAGLNENDLHALESTIGTAKMLRLFMQLGEVTGESGFAGDGGGGGFFMSASVAQAKLDELRGKRMKGEINEAQWKSTYQGEYERLAQIVARGS